MSEQSMIERVARAIDPLAWQVTEQDLALGSRDKSEKQRQADAWNAKRNRRIRSWKTARDVLAAMREPTEGMVERASKQTTYRDAYQIMIDTALDEG